MILRFNIEYHTSFDEQLVLNIDGNDGKHSAYRMSSLDGQHWTCEINAHRHVGDVINYHYSVDCDGQMTRHEWLVAAHRLEMASEKGVNYIIYDHWIDMPEDSYLYSSAFTECVARHAVVKSPVKPFTTTIRLKVRAPQLRQDERLAIIGADAALGGWEVRKALPMSEHNYNEWVVNLDATKIQSNPIEFKFVVLDEEDDVTPLWEGGCNRYVELPPLEAGDVVVYELPAALFPIYNQKIAGTLVPVFSLRSKTSFGVGDFGDLKKMIDWVSLTRQRVLQVLPINDTTNTRTWTDSYPYSCISIFALHPQYADFTSLPALADKKKAEEFEALRQELNALPQIDYERVNNAKNEYLQLLYQQEGKRVLSSAKFKKFFEEEKHWLVPYAQYCSLRDRYGTADYSQWPDHRSWNEKDRAPLSSSRTKQYKEVAYSYFVQFLLYSQMCEVHEYARQHGVILKGDIPIGVNRYGCDVWQEPRYFNLNGQAGAPPDDFSVNGQNWGFPTYNWEAMLADDCLWWVRRFQNMAKYFDAYRIDHVLGFFRIWEIPVDAVHGLLGQFAPALAMTREEIEAYGLHFQDELFLEPFIMDWTLERIFHEDADYVKQQFLEPTHDGRYRMKPEYDTQRKIEAWYQNEELIMKNEESSSKAVANSSLITHHLSLPDLRDGLYALISDVLFVRDHRNPEKFHPRISAQLDFIYESLYDSDKFVFNKIYNDYYYRRNNQFWYREAMKKLPLLVQATRMLVCAEDLGMVPDCVPWVMNELRILSLELQSMPKDPTVKFGHLSRNPYRSVCTISSHDMPTLRMWWDEDEQRTQEYYSTMLYRGDQAPHPLPGWLARDIISRHLTCPSMLCVLALQDWLAIDERLRLPDANAERVNIPANPRHYWRYRMHLNLEDLLAADAFNNNVRELITQAGRK
ncbi:MAG: 4-alpha-glucanotransferase [Prevotella sp.]|nr:4-alpha-glucanotransferase [Prevotella sp.]